LKLTDWYKLIASQLAAENIKVKYKQPSQADTLPLVHINVHTDLDMSNKFATLNQVTQQIDLYAEGTTPPLDFEDMIDTVKRAISRTPVRWDALTTQTTIDDSTGRDIKRAMLLVMVTL